MLSTTLLFALDNTIVANIKPAVINDFGHLELLSWIGTGFALGTMFILLWGKIYGVFNIKWVYIFNIVLFEAGIALCGVTPNMTALIIGRVVAGIGGSGMYSAQDLGMILFLAISGSLFHNVAVDKFGKALPDFSEKEIGNLIAESSSKASQALSGTEKTLMTPEIASAMTTIWAFFLAAAALSVLCSLPLLSRFADA
ncbi:hypothetical protein GGP41_000356 [Bipolaris sorokiniana]|uniref:Major facilitator superfamily (MFS) profile domain-containing protein n=1 Tax=Cochliobolus sativus TaxID=45130 RepID=A0A8H5ZC73_COCSA|nr:hypothetical protein GGP41_000356 [Bipolaris sorokiniana]